MGCWGGGEDVEVLNWLGYNFIDFRNIVNIFKIKVKLRGVVEKFSFCNLLYGLWKWV